MYKLINKMQHFAKDRDWEQFHSPKNLAMSLGVEVGELMEIFQWLTDEQSNNLPRSKLDLAKSEIADIQIYLAMLADKLGIDILEAAMEKISLNEKKYPVEKAKGSAKKYTDL